jgi:hypothetical protein
LLEPLGYLQMKHKSSFKQFKSQSVSAKIPYRIVQTVDSPVVAAYATGSVNLMPASLGPRAVAMQSIYSKFRLNSLRVRYFTDTNLVPVEISGATATPIGGMIGVGYSNLPLGDQTTPASFTDLSQLNVYDFCSSSREARITVPTQTLRSIPYLWLRTSDTGSPPPDEISAGTIFLVVRSDSSLAAAYKTWFVIEGELEFTGQISSADVLGSYPDVELKTVVFPISQPRLENEYVSLDRPRVEGDVPSSSREFIGDYGVTASPSSLLTLSRQATCGPRLNSSNSLISGPSMPSQRR